MTPTEIVAALASEGVELALRGGRLCTRPAPGPALVELVRRYATELRQLLRDEAGSTAERIVRCSTCLHWTADWLGGGGIGKCATGADAESWSAHDRRPLSPWPDAPRHCAGWEGASRG